MRRIHLAMLLALLLPSMASAQSTTAAIPAYITAAINDPARHDDAANDARRKIGDIATFAQLKPGQRVLELIPGGGYFTRVFSAIVGPQGHVFVVRPQEYLKDEPDGLSKSQAIAAMPHYANVSVLTQPAAKLSSPEPVDLVFTSQNYHDYPDAFMGKVDPAVLNREVFAALKPGGLFVIVDHAAPAGSGMADTDTLHRIDPAIVKAQVEAAGFVFEGQSQALQNPGDDHTLKVFDPAIRGKTDQFIYRFRKPAG